MARSETETLVELQFGDLQFKTSSDYVRTMRRLGNEFIIKYEYNIGSHKTNQGHLFVRGSKRGWSYHLPEFQAILRNDIIDYYENRN